MKILHIITSLATGGAEHLMVDLLPRLRELGNEAELLVFDGRRTPFYEQLEKTGITINSLGMGGNVYHPRNLLRLTQFLHQHRYDIVHTHNTACQLYAPMARILSRSTFRLFTTEHNTTNRRRGKWWLKPIDHWMYGRYERIVCISDQAQSNLVKYIGNKPSITTIFNGVDTQRFVRPVKDIANLSEFVITMIAAFRPQKDQETLIHALELLPSNYMVQFVGSGTRLTEVQEMAKRSAVADRITFLGNRTDIPELMEISDVMVLSSHWEGLSLSSIEGMASGRPFVASDVDGLREVVQGAGVLFPEGDAPTLARAIQELCENPELYRNVADRCQQRAKQFDISLMANRYSELYFSEPIGPVH